MKGVGWGEEASITVFMCVRLLIAYTPTYSYWTSTFFMPFFQFIGLPCYYEHQHLCKIGLNFLYSFIRSY